ncbi:MAG: DUF1552 domain-containing protein [Reinekea sp.]|jgi:hypothetical protein
MDQVKQFAQMKRRSFLKFIGQAGISLPVLQASGLGAGLMLSRQAMAAGETPRRVIFIYVPGGTPNGGSNTYLPDSDFNLKSCSQPLDNVKDECVFFKDVEIVGGGGHGLTPRVLGAFGDNNKGSIDLALEDTIGATSPIASLRLGVMATAGSNSTPVSARGWTVVTDIQDNPQTAFDRLFGGSVDSSPIGTKRDLLRLSANKQALKSLKGKLGVYEQQRLDQHLASINKLSQDITNASSSDGGIAGCSNVLFNPNGYATEQVKANFTHLFDLQVENALLALKCELTKVVTIQIATDAAAFSAPGLDSDYHSSIHSGSLAFYESYRIYLSERVAHLIKRLQEEDDGNGGRMIDSTLVVQVTETADGSQHSAGGQDVKGVGGHAPFMFAGGGSAINRKSIVSASNHHRILDVVTDYMGVQGTIGLYDSGSTGTVPGVLS